MSEQSIFSRIIARELPATILYEDESWIAIHDIHPKAPVHLLVIPKHPYPTLEDVAFEDTDFHADLLRTGRKVAAMAGIGKNYKCMLNVGLDVQIVHHIHLHVMGGWEKPEA